MSTAVFQYGEMNNAARRAKDTAKRLSDYSDGLRRRVCSKLDAYSGSRTSNIYRADRELEAKRRQLEQRSQDLEQYGEAMEELVSSCKDTDQRVERMVSELTGDFKARHDIGSNPVWETLCSALTWCKNSTAAGRLLSGLWERGVNALGEAWDRMKTWYKYDGGKYLLTENLKAALGIALGVAGVVAGIAALIGAGTVLAAVAAIAGIVAGAFAVVNGVVDMINNHRAGAMAAERPGEAVRTNEINSGAAWLRKSDEQWCHKLALALDITEIAAGVTSLVSSAGTLLKKGYAWLSGSKNLNIKTLSFSTIKSNLSHQNWKTMASARWQDIKKGAQAFTNILRSGSKAQIKTAVSTQFKFLLENFKKPHVKAWTGIKNMFQQPVKANTVAAGAGGISHFLSLIKSPLSGIGGTLKDNLVFNSLATSGDNSISLSDIKSNIKKFTGTVGNVADLFKHYGNTDVGKITKRIYELRGNGNTRIPRPAPVH